MESQAQHLPRLKFLGSWAHGHAGCFYFIEEDMQKDSSLTVEALFTTIEESRKQAAAKGRSLPADLWIQLDNTSGENKNQYVFSALAAVVKRQIFKSAVLAFLCPVYMFLFQQYLPPQSFVTNAQRTAAWCRSGFF